jgi:UDP-N-acetylmuramoylalanine--D-glutamate ligase
MDRVKHVIAIGEIAERLEATLKNNGFDNVSTGFSSMQEIVTTAQKLAAPGDVVLLSAGTSSFGMFKDYKDRGDQFKQAVLALN